MGNEIAIRKDLEKRRVQAWSKFAVSLTEKEDELAAAAIRVGEALSVAVTIDNIKESEHALKTQKEAIKSLEKLRASVTGPLDKVKSRLIVFEKEAKEKLKGFEDSIISAKKDHEAAVAAENGKSEEEKDLIEKIKLSYVEYESAVDQYIKGLILDEYTKMLDEGVKFKDFDAHVSEIKVEKIKHAPYFVKQGFKTRYLTEEEFKTLYKLHNKPAVDFIALFAEGIMAKKAGYRSELANKEKAKELLAEQAKKDEANRKEKEQQERLAVNIDKAASMDAKPKSDIKELKQTYKVDMPDDVDSALKLYACFSANLDAVKSKLSVKKWLELKPSSIATALGKLKSQDNSLEFSGISFKIVEKL